MISKYLSDLLADNKRVVVPNFGGFVVKRSAVGDIVSFNTFLTFDDGILLNKIMEEEGCNEGHAHKIIHDIVEEINAGLDSKGEFAIKGVGYLVKDKKGSIRFLEHLPSKDKKQAAAVSEPSSVVSKKEVPEVERTPRPKRKRIVIRWYWYALVLLIALLVFGIKKMRGVLVEEQQKIVNQKVEEVINAPEDAAPKAEVVYEPIMEPLTQDSVHGIHILADRDIATKGQERYHVIIAAFSVYENAEKFQSALLEDEYASEIFDRYNGFYAVSIGSYPSLDIALKVCGKKVKEVEGVWILVK